MNAGDRFAGPGVLGQVSARLDGAGPAPDVLFGGATLVFPGGRRWYRGPRNMERYIWHGLPAIHQATYYRRSRVRDTGYDPSYRVCGDYEIVARLFTGGASAAYLDAPLVDFMVGGTSFRTRGPLFAEPLRVQTEILHAGPLRKALSLARRLVSTVAVTVLHGRGGASPEGHSPVRPRGA